VDETQVDLSDVLDAAFQVREADDSRRADAEATYSETFAKFERRVGRRASMIEPRVAAVWLDDRREPELHVLESYLGFPADLAPIFSELGVLTDKAERLLSGRDRGRILLSIYAALTHVLVLAERVHAVQVDGEPLAGDDYPLALQRAWQATRESAEEFGDTVQRAAQFWYFQGMAVGAAALGACAAVVAMAAPYLPRVDVVSADSIAGCLIGGALGAVFSVLSRMTSGSLTLKADSGRELLRLLGAVRPVVGAVAGVGLYFFIDGGALNVLSRPDDPARSYSYYTAFAFLAGFSERFFQDMLATHSVTNRDKEGATRTNEASSEPPHVAPGTPPSNSGARQEATPPLASQRSTSSRQIE